MIWSDHILRDKRILITGASSGIGRACATVCSQLGAQIVALGRDSQRLQETLDCLDGEGHISIECELTDSEQLHNKLTALKDSQSVSGFIHSAGIERTNPLKSIDSGSFAEMFKINVISAVQIAGIISAPKMYDKNGCGFVLISSISGRCGEKGKIEYSSTKSAIYGAVKSLAKELAAKGIRVNSISPAMVDTPMLQTVFNALPAESVQAIQARHFLGIPKPDEVANLCAYLISDLGRSITGTNITIDSGYSLV